MVNKSLKNKKIIISAGASGIGLATAKVCLSRGAYVYLCDIDNKSLNKLKKHPLINKRLFKYNCDASHWSSLLTEADSAPNSEPRRVMYCNVLHCSS